MESHRCLKCRRVFTRPQQYVKDRRWATKGGFGYAYYCRDTTNCAIRALERTKVSTPSPEEEWK